MGQRTQLHVKKNNQFYVIYNQWGYGKYMIQDICKLIICGLLDEQINHISFFRLLSKAFVLEDEDTYYSTYYSVDKGDNNNGVFLIDCDLKAYGFLLGHEQLPYIGHNTSFKYIRPIIAVDYLSKFNDEDKKMAENIDGLFKDKGYQKLLYHTYNKKEKKYLLESFLKKSNKFDKQKNNSNSFYAKANEEYSDMMGNIFEQLKLTDYKKVSVKTAIPITLKKRGEEEFELIQFNNKK